MSGARRPPSTPAVERGGPGRAGRVLFAAVVALEVVLVVGAFDPAPHTGGDNAMYVSLAHALLTTGSYVELFDPAGLLHTKYPPVFPALLAGLIALGARGWVALKSTAAVSTVVAVAFTYLWAARRTDRWTAAVVAGLLGISSAVIYYSHWVLSDPLFLALTMVALWAVDRAEGRLFVVGLVAATLAYLTRSAGLPLVVALGAWLAWRKAWRPLALTSVVVGVPALWWWSRGLGAAGSYATEFWMVDPYQPALGTIGVGALLPRALENVTGYMLAHGPGGIVGARGTWVSALGVALVAAALWGWVRSVRNEVGPAELFFPLYAGLILLWPVVWSGDRFALPLYPLLFFYGAVALADLRARGPRLVGAAATGLLLVALVVPAAASWVRASGDARACAGVVAAEGPWGCYGPRVGAFVEAAEWSEAALPEGASVMTRKPGIFYVSSGVPSRTFPFDPDPAAHLALADQLGVRYVLIDEWDALAGAYVGRAVAARPGAFCFVRAFGDPGRGGAQLLGIFPPEMRASAGATSSDEVRIGFCPPGYVVPDVTGDQASSSSSGAIPLLRSLDP